VLVLIVRLYHDAGQQNIKFLIIVYLNFSKYKKVYKLIVAQSTFHRKWSFIPLFTKTYHSTQENSSTFSRCACTYFFFVWY